MDDEKFSLTIRVTALCHSEFKNVQIPVNPEYFDATPEGYEKAIERMEDVWQDALTRRVMLYLYEINGPATNQVLLEDWNKDEEIPLSDEEE